MTNPVPPPPPYSVPPPPGDSVISAAERCSARPCHAMTSVPSQQASGSALLSSAAPEPSSYTLISADPQLYDDLDVQAYNELLEKISATVRPKDFIEEIWISDVVYLQVEIYSLRRLKVDLPKAAMPDALVDVFSLVANSGNWFVKNRERTMR